jgi:hypothetical protein
MAEFENSFFNRYKASKKKTGGTPRGKTRQKTSNRPTPEQTQRANAATAQLGEKLKSIAAPYGELKDMKETRPVDYEQLTKQAGQNMKRNQREALSKYFSTPANIGIGLASGLASRFYPIGQGRSSDELAVRAMGNPLISKRDDILEKATTQARGGLSAKDAFTQEMLKIMKEKKQ